MTKFPCGMQHISKMQWVWWATLSYSSGRDLTLGVLWPHYSCWISGLWGTMLTVPHRHAGAASCTTKQDGTDNYWATKSYWYGQSPLLWLMTTSLGQTEMRSITIVGVTWHTTTFQLRIPFIPRENRRYWSITMHLKLKPAPLMVKQQIMWKGL